LALLLGSYFLAHTLEIRSKRAASSPQSQTVAA
jgi:hypothetical protein